MGEKNCRKGGGDTDMNRYKFRVLKKDVINKGGPFGIPIQIPHNYWKENLCLLSDMLMSNNKSPKLVTRHLPNRQI